MLKVSVILTVVIKTQEYQKINPRKRIDRKVNFVDPSRLPFRVFSIFQSYHFIIILSDIIIAFVRNHLTASRTNQSLEGRAPICASTELRARIRLIGYLKYFVDNISSLQRETITPVNFRIATKAGECARERSLSCSKSSC